jgi:serine phosphatase RsbU (regulator of sigma subunit)
VSGDFYDVFELDLDHWGAVIGDVVGKGAQAAAMMGLARYTLRTAALTESRPSALLRTLNDAIIRQTRESMFCTACFARVHRRETDVRVTLASGGHPLPIVIRADGTVGAVGAPGTLLGIFDDPTLNDRALDLHPGDAIVLYTDGVTDERRDDEEFGEARLLETLRSLAGGDAKAIADGVVRAVEDFRTGLAHDDIAILVIRIRPDPGGSR